MVVCGSAWLCAPVKTCLYDGRSDGLFGASSRACALILHAVVQPVAGGSGASTRCSYVIIIIIINFLNFQLPTGFVLVG